MEKLKINNPPLLIKRDFETLFYTMDAEDAGILLVSLMRWHWHGEEPNLSEVQNAYFNILKSFTQADVEKYQEKCAKNRQIALEREENRRAKANK